MGNKIFQIVTLFLCLASEKSDDTSLESAFLSDDGVCSDENGGRGYQDRDTSGDEEEGHLDIHMGLMMKERCTSFSFIFIPSSEFCLIFVMTSVQCVFWKCRSFVGFMSISSELMTSNDI